MQFTINIDTSNNKAQAFIDFIKTLDFIKIGEKDSINSFTLSDEQKNILDERENKHLNNESQSFSWNEVKDSLRNSSK
ncbi:MAG: addiction module protein [Bacteroidota bacterium]|nr:addiction module protein [Bacteroidota bacterium]